MLTNDKMLLNQAKGSWLERWLKKYYNSALARVMKFKKIVLSLQEELN